MERLTKALHAQTKAMQLLAESNRALADSVYEEPEGIPGSQAQYLS